MFNVFLLLNISLLVSRVSAMFVQNTSSINKASNTFAGINSGLLDNSTYPNWGWDLRPISRNGEENVHETSQDILVESPEVFSCSGKCGEPGSIPCSCSKTCIIYRNCCEDMETACPRLTRAARLSFIHMLTNTPQSTCLSSGYNVVTSCDGRLFPTAENTYLDNMLDNIPPAERLSVLLNHVPYTDETTGLTFLNKDIFDCNSAGPRGIPWRAYVATNGFPENGYTSGEFSKNIFHNCFVYLPPKSMENTKQLSECTDLYIDVCMVYDDVSTVTACNEGDVVYVQSDELAFMVFKNKYCAQCHDPKPTKLLPYKREFLSDSPCVNHGLHHYPLSIILALTDRNVRIDVVSHESDVPQHPADFQGGLVWQPTCNIPVSQTETGHGLMLSTTTISCDVTHCPEHLVSWEGACQPVVLVTLGVAQGQCQTSDLDLERMSGLWQCYLGNILRLDVLQSLGSEVRYSNTLRKMVTFNQFKVVSKSPDAVMDFLKGDLHLMKLAYFAAAISVVSQRHENCGSEHTPSRAVQATLKHHNIDGIINIGVCLQATLITPLENQVVGTDLNSMDRDNGVDCDDIPVAQDEMEFVDVYVNGSCLAELYVQNNGKIIHDVTQSRQLGSVMAATLWLVAVNILAV